MEWLAALWVVEWMVCGTAREATKAKQLNLWWGKTNKLLVSIRSRWQACSRRPRHQPDEGVKEEDEEENLVAAEEGRVWRMKS